MLILHYYKQGQVHAFLPYSYFFALISVNECDNNIYIKCKKISQQTLIILIKRLWIYTSVGYFYLFDTAILVEFHHIDAGYPVVG